MHEVGYPADWEVLKSLASRETPFYISAQNLSRRRQFLNFVRRWRKQPFERVQGASPKRCSDVISESVSALLVGLGVFWLESSWKLRWNPESRKSF